MQSIVRPRAKILATDMQQLICCNALPGLLILHLALVPLPACHRLQRVSLKPSLFRCKPVQAKDGLPLTRSPPGKTWLRRMFVELRPTRPGGSEREPELDALQHGNTPIPGPRHWKSFPAPSATPRPATPRVVVVR